MKLLQCHDKQMWDDYVIEHGGHPLQMWGWGDVKTAHNWQAHRLFLHDSSDEVVGSAQILVRHLPWPLKSLSYIPRGPIVDDENREQMLSLLVKYAKSTYKSVALTIEPDSEEYSVPKGWVKSKSHILQSNTIILDLTKSTEDLMKVMDPNTRRYIRRFEAGEAVVKKINNREGLNDCLAVYHQTARRARFNLHDDQYYYDIFDKMGENSVLYIAYVDEKPVAFLWLAISAETAYELYGGMTEEGRKLNASYGLKWHAISKSKEWGLARYDFGGMIDGGVTAFKKAWDSKQTVLAGTFDYPFSIYYSLWINGLPFAKSIIRRIKAVIGR